MFEVEKARIATEVRAILHRQDIEAAEAIDWTPIPFSGEWGVSTSFFRIAAQELRAARSTEAAQESVPQRAQRLAELVAGSLGGLPDIQRVEAVKGYLNLYFSPAAYSRRVIDTVLEAGAEYGRHPQNGQQVMVEFSQPNTHKPLHVGHLRNMILGDAICTLLEAAGYEVLRVNYPGDTGLHVIKWIWNYLRNHAGEKPPEDVVRWMGDIYTEANQLLEDSPELEAEMRALFQRWLEKDPEVMALWEQTRRWSLDGFSKMYEALGIEFDFYYYQSEVEDRALEIVADLIERGLAIDERPEGPVIVRIDDLLNLSKEQYRVMVILRSDGTTLYSTWDLALAIRKFEDYPDLAQSIYVIDVRQSLHLQQAWKTLQIMGYPWTDRLVHLPYEIVNLPGNVTMKSREGTVVLLEDLLREAHKRALAIVEEKNPELGRQTQEAVAEAVAIGSIKYPMLARDNTKIATFDWESALDFNGQAAPYIQYAHVRANSILRRLEGPLPGSSAPEYQLNPKEVELIDLISRLPDEVLRAAAEYKTLHLTNLAFDLARAFNDFYNACPVLQAEPPVRSVRLRLVAAARQTLANVLRILGIIAPDVM
jgi:arginyl-tRNA synthetase